MPAASPITVAVARFEDLLGLGLRGVIATDASLKIVAHDFEHDRIGVILRAHRPRVAILDLDALPSPAQVRQLGGQYPETRLVLLTSRPATATSSQLLAFGASACLGRSIQARDVLTAIHLAARGLQLIPRGSHDSGVEPPAGSQLLTQREADVLPLLQQGSSNAQIALALHVSVETVRSHARNIYRKLGVSSRRELATPPPRTPVKDAESASPPPARRWGTAARGRQRRPGSLRK